MKLRSFRCSGKQASRPLSVAGHLSAHNRAYHQEYMRLQAMAGRRSRGITNSDIGAMVKSGQPALVDVVSEPR
jgi:hypothetical protein